MRWIAPVQYECNHYEEDFKESRDLCHGGTCEWIWGRPEYNRWYQSSRPSSDSLLCLYAIPGAGKTVLASHVIDRLTKRKDLVLYFFFKQSDADKETSFAAVRALVHQLLHLPNARHKHEFFDKIVNLMYSGAKTRAASFRALWDTFCIHVSKLPNIIIVLDALDECSDAEQLLPTLLSLARRGTSRILVTSRREAGVGALLEGVPSLHFGVAEVKEDIRLYIEHRISKSAKLSSDRVRPHVTEMLNAYSNGMFLWVVLVIKELELAVSSFDLLKAIKSPPRGMDDAYGRILRRLAVLNPSQITLCCRLLRWLVLAKRELRLDEVYEAIKHEYSWEFGAAGPQSLLSWKSELEVIGGSLVTVRNESISLMHLTAHDYLQRDPSQLGLEEELHKFFINAGVENARITSLCTTYLSSHCHAWEAHNGKIYLPQLKSALPFIEYACQFWLLHLVQSSPQELVKYRSELETFLLSRNPFYWIEFSVRLEEGGCTMIKFLVESLLDWVSLKWTEVSTKASQLISLLKFWGKSYLRLLTEWEQHMDRNPYIIHSVDPSTIFQSYDFGIRAHLEQCMMFQRHVVFHKVDTFTQKLSPPQNRCLTPRAFERQIIPFIFNRSRGIIISVEKGRWQTPRLLAQEMKSGRRLEPISDIEFYNIDVSVTMQSLAMSPDAQHFGVGYSWFDGCETVLYSSVWRISDCLDFKPERALDPWAIKIESSTTRLKQSVSSSQMIAFDGAGYVYCPTIRINLIDHSVGRLRFLPDEDARWGEFSFSKDGTVTAFVDYAKSTIALISSHGMKEIPSLKDGIAGLHVSNTGRYVIIRSINGYHSIYDRRSKRKTRLDPRLHPQSETLFRFNDADDLLFGAFEHANVVSRETTTIHLWAMEGSSFTHQAAHTREGIVSTMEVDDADRVLHIVSDGCIWSRLDYSALDLQELDSALVVRKYSRVEYEVSRDAKQLAVLHIGRSR